MSKAKDTAPISNKAGMNPIMDTETPDPTAGSIRINGFQQVIEMLRIADPAFRESLLKRLAMKDRELANSLRKDLAAENN